jgi:hypothetical protein
VRFEQSGLELACAACLLYVKGHWAEMAHTFGYCGWNVTFACCMYCKATADDIHDIEGLGLDSSPHEILTPDDFERACESCERIVTMRKW